MSSSLLIEEPPLQVIPTLACAVGLNEAVILQQIHYWITNKQKAPEQYMNSFRAGSDGVVRIWVYNSIPGWQKQFPFWSANTIRRAFAALIKQKVILAEQLSDDTRDKTMWYAIDYSVLAKIDIDSPSTQNGQMDYPKWADAPSQNDDMDVSKMGKSRARVNARAYPETTTETTTNTTQNGAVAPNAPVVLNHTVSDSPVPDSLIPDSPEQNTKAEESDVVESDVAGKSAIPKRRGSPRRSSASRFADAVPVTGPPMDEVKAFFKAEGHEQSADEFFDLYAERGWVVGQARSPMVDWKASARRFMRNTNGYKRPEQASAAPPPPRTTPTSWPAPPGGYARGNSKADQMFLKLQAERRAKKEAEASLTSQQKGESN